MLRFVAFVALAAVLCTLGCGDDDSASPARVDTKTATVAQSQGMRKPIVTKKYFEDLIGEPDANGNYEEEYRFWDYTFDFGGRQYHARVYTDEPEAAYVDPIGSDGTVMDGLGADGNIDMDEVGALKPQDPRERANLRAILRHLSQDGWPKIVIHTLAGDEGYKPLRLD